jgi:hypothetical protein
MVQLVAFLSSGESARGTIRGFGLLFPEPERIFAGAGDRDVSGTA